MLHMAKHSAAKSADKQKILDTAQENAESEAAAKALAAEELDERCVLRVASCVGVMSVSS